MAQSEEPVKATVNNTGSNNRKSKYFSKLTNLDKEQAGETDVQPAEDIAQDNVKEPALNSIPATKTE